MTKKETNIEVRVERAGKDDSPVRRVVVEIAGGCSIDVALQDGIVAVRLAAAGNGVRLATDGAHCDFVRAINLLRLHLPKCRT